MPKSDWLHYSLSILGYTESRVRNQTVCCRKQNKITTQVSPVAKF